MPEEILNDINTQKETDRQEIDRQEIEQALKPDGILTKPENIQKIKEYLKSSEKSELLSSLEGSLNDAIDQILSQSEISDNDIKILDLWNKLLGESNVEKKEDIKQKINNLVQNISEISNRRIANTRALPISSFYSEKDIKTIQLWANICFGENIQITGER